jgi:hypothetical protein
VFKSHPRLQRHGSGGSIDRAHASAGDDPRAHRHGGSEVGAQALDDSCFSRPPGDRGGHVAHREHAVRDDPVEPDAPCERVVLVQRVLVTPSVCVGLHVCGGDDPGEFGKLLPFRELVERGHASRSIIWDRARQTSPSSSRSSVSIVRNPVPPFCLIEATFARTMSVSPSRSGRSNRYSCEP